MVKTKRVFLGTILALATVATVAYAATSGDRLKSPVKVGQGTAVLESLTFDQGGSSSPLIQATAGGSLQLSTDGGTSLVTVPAITGTVVMTAGTQSITGAKTFGGVTTPITIGADADAATRQMDIRTAAAQRASINLDQGGTTVTTFSTAASSNDLTPGSAAGDTVLRLTTKNFLLSTDNGTTTGFKFTSGDQATFDGNTSPVEVGSDSSTADRQLEIRSGSAHRATVNLYQNGSVLSLYSTASGSADLAPGTVAGDTVIRTTTKKFVLSTDNGTTATISVGTDNKATFNGVIDPVGGFGTTTDGAAGSGASGLVTTGTQTFAGAKTFNGTIDPVGGFGTTTDGAASASTSGIVTTVGQVFAGNKSFNGVLDPVGGFGTTTDGAAGASASGLVTTAAQTLGAGLKTINNGLQFANATGSYTPATLDYYEEGTFTITGTGFASTVPTATVSFVRIGKLVTLQIPAVTGTANATPVGFTGLLSRLQPTHNVAVACPVEDNAVYNAYRCAILAGTTTILLKKQSGADISGVGASGLDYATFSYTLN